MHHSLNWCVHAEIHILHNQLNKKHQNALWCKESVKQDSVWLHHQKKKAHLASNVEQNLVHWTTSCPKVLAEGPYRWRHGKILPEIAKWEEKERVKTNNKQAWAPKAMNLVRKGDKVPKNSMAAKNPPSTLQRTTTRNWVWSWRGSLCSA